MSIDGARGIVFTITGGPNLGMTEVSDAAKVITASADSEAKIIFGAVIDEKLKDEIKVTVVATGFDGQGQDAGKQLRAYTPNAFIAEKDDKNRSWFGTKTDTAAEAPRKNKISPVKMAQEELPDEESEEGELGIPAFIRKKMK
jgi:cell division GTPase FtsZ